MKNFFITLFTSLIIFSCNREVKNSDEVSVLEDSPRKVAQSYIELRAKGMIEELKPYCTEGTFKKITTLTGMGLLKAEPFRNFEYTFIKDTIIKDFALVYYKFNKESKNIHKCKLYKIDGKWLVHQN